MSEGVDIIVYIYIVPSLVVPMYIYTLYIGITIGYTSGLWLASLAIGLGTA